MKKLLLIFFTTFLFLNQAAQVEFCPPGAHWTSAYYSGGFPQSTGYFYAVNTDFLYKDTLNNDSVKVLSSSRFFLNGSDGNNAPIYIKQIGDTVFMNTIYTNNKWQVLFNFGAAIGQKWYNTLLPQSQSLLSYTNTVVSSQTVLINGFMLKQLGIEQEIDGSWYTNSVSYTITERLGSNRFVFTFDGVSNPDGASFGTNLCYSDNTFGTYYFVGNSCVVTTGLQDHEMESIKLNLFPNPTNNNLSIQNEGTNSSNNYSYLILNTIGEKVKEGSLNFLEKEAKISTIDLAKGIYFITIRDSKSSTKIVSKRFVKTD